MSLSQTVPASFLDKNLQLNQALEKLAKYKRDKQLINTRIGNLEKEIAISKEGGSSAITVSQSDVLSLNTTDVVKRIALLAQQRQAIKAKLSATLNKKEAFLTGLKDRRPKRLDKVIYLYEEKVSEYLTQLEAELIEAKTQFESLNEVFADIERYKKEGMINDEEYILSTHSMALEEDKLRDMLKIVQSAQKQMGLVPTVINFTSDQTEEKVEEISTVSIEELSVDERANIGLETLVSTTNEAVSVVVDEERQLPVETSGNLTDDQKLPAAQYYSAKPEQIVYVAPSLYNRETSVKQLDMLAQILGKTDISPDQKRAETLSFRTNTANCVMSKENKQGILEAIDLIYRLENTPTGAIVMRDMKMSDLVDLGCLPIATAYLMTRCKNKIGFSHINDLLDLLIDSGKETITKLLETMGDMQHPNRKKTAELLARTLINRALIGEVNLLNPKEGICLNLEAMEEDCHRTELSAENIFLGVENEGFSTVASAIEDYDFELAQEVYSQLVDQFKNSSEGTSFAKRSNKPGPDLVTVTPVNLYLPPSVTLRLMGENTTELLESIQILLKDLGLTFGKNDTIKVVNLLAAYHKSLPSGDNSSLLLLSENEEEEDDGSDEADSGLNEAELEQVRLGEEEEEEEEEDDVVVDEDDDEEEVFEEETCEEDEY